VRREILRAATFAALATLAGCGPAQPPESLRQLEVLAGENDAGNAASAATTAWAEAQRYLALASEALDSGDAVSADRLATLGLIQGKLAMTSLRERRTRERLEATAEVESQRKLEIERLTSAIAAMEQLMARDRSRRHVEAVIDASRRRAAALEEQSARTRQGDPRLGEARLEVGREMLGRGRVEAAVLGALVEVGAALEEQKASADGAVALAEQALGREDLATLQERIEEVGAGAHRAFVWAFEGAAGVPSERISGFVKSLTAAGFTAVPDGYGAAVSLAGGMKGKQAVCADAERLAALAAALEDAPRHAILTVDPRGAHPFPALDDGKGKCPAALVVPLPDSP
jgi:hypothetical protein